MVGIELIEEGCTTCVISIGIELLYGRLLQTEGSLG